MHFENNYLLFVAVVILLLIYYNSNKKCQNNERYYENLHNIDANDIADFASFDPKYSQSGLHADVKQHGFMGLPDKVEYPWSENYGKIDDLAGQKLNDLNFGLCSKSCCAPQYPVPFSMEPDKFVDQSGKKYTYSGNLTCNNSWQNTGCLCLTEKDSKLLSSRGNNTR